MIWNHAAYDKNAPLAFESKSKSQWSFWNAATNLPAAAYRSRPSGTSMSRTASAHSGTYLSPFQAMRTRVVTPSGSSCSQPCSSGMNGSFTASMICASRSSSSRLDVLGSKYFMALSTFLSASPKPRCTCRTSAISKYSTLATISPTVSTAWCG